MNSNIIGDDRFDDPFGNDPDDDPSENNDPLMDDNDIEKFNDIVKHHRPTSEEHKMNIGSFFIYTVLGIILIIIGGIVVYYLYFVEPIIPNDVLNSTFSSSSSTLLDTTSTTPTTTSTTTTTIRPQNITIVGLPINESVYFYYRVDVHNNKKVQTNFSLNNYTIPIDYICDNYTERYFDTRIRFETKNLSMQKYIEIEDNYCDTGLITVDWESLFV